MNIASYIKYVQDLIFNCKRKLSNKTLVILYNLNYIAAILILERKIKFYDNYRQRDRNKYNFL